MSATILFLLGLVALVVGGELLVRGAARLATALGISSLVIGLTVVAFGTSAPELAVSVTSALADQAGLAVGNVVGSNIFNVLLILGLSALITPLAVSLQLVRVEVPLMIGASAALPLLALDGGVSRTDGALLLGSGVLYTVAAIRASRRESGSRSRGPLPLASAGQIVVGLALLVVGSRWLVAAATAAATALGVSDLVIGLTVVAAGTSLPEVAASVTAAIRGERDIAVGNVVGSNLFNLLVVLGGAALAAPGGVPVPAVAMRLDIPIMIAVAVACLPIFATGHRIDRWEGGLFLAAYAAYVATLVFTATPGRSAELFSPLMLGIALPLVGATLAAISWHAIRPPAE